MLKTLPVDQSVGTVLPHDITEIVRGSYKGSVFKKGHIIRLEDIEHLKKLGKDNIYILSLEPDIVSKRSSGKICRSSVFKSNVSSLLLTIPA